MIAWSPVAVCSLVGGHLLRLLLGVPWSLPRIGVEGLLYLQELDSFFAFI